MCAKRPKKPSIPIIMFIILKKLSLFGNSFGSKTQKQKTMLPADFPRAVFGS